MSTIRWSALVHIALITAVTMPFAGAGVRPSPIEARSQRVAEVSGVVVDAAGEPIAARVSAWQRDGGVVMGRALTGGRDGAFRLRLPHGEYGLDIETDDGRRAELNWLTVAGRTELVKPIRIRDRASRPGLGHEPAIDTTSPLIVSSDHAIALPVQGIAAGEPRVEFARAGESVEARDVIFDRERGLILLRAPEMVGDAEVRLIEDDAVVTSVPIEILPLPVEHEDHELELEARTAWNAPVANALVMLLVDAPEASIDCETPLRLHDYGRTERDGSIALQHPGDGRRATVLLLPTADTSLAPKSWTGSLPSRDLERELRVRPGRPVRLSVANPRGEPLAGARVAYAAHGIFDQRLTGSDGRVELRVPDVADGHEVFVRGPVGSRYLPRALDVHASSPLRDVRLHEGYFVTGAIVGLNDPITVSVTAKRATPPWSRLDAVSTDADFQLVVPKNVPLEVTAYHRGDAEHGMIALRSTSAVTSDRILYPPLQPVEAGVLEGVLARPEQADEGDTTIVSVHDPDEVAPRRALRQARVCDDGSFRILMPQGVYTLSTRTMRAPRHPAWFSAKSGGSPAPRESAALVEIASDQVTRGVEMPSRVSSNEAGRRVAPEFVSLSSSRWTRTSPAPVEPLSLQALSRCEIVDGWRVDRGEALVDPARWTSMTRRERREFLETIAEISATEGGPRRVSAVDSTTGETLGTASAPRK
jgi:hypothetical protein